MGQYVPSSEQREIMNSTVDVRIQMQPQDADPDNDEDATSEDAERKQRDEALSECAQVLAARNAKVFHSHSEAHHDQSSTVELESLPREVPGVLVDPVKQATRIWETLTPNEQLVIGLLDCVSGRIRRHAYKKWSQYVEIGTCSLCTGSGSCSLNLDICLKFVCPDVCHKLLYTNDMKPKSQKFLKEPRHEICTPTAHVATSATTMTTMMTTTTTIMGMDDDDDDDDDAWRRRPLAAA
jgi:hypothetical protein